MTKINPALQFIQLEGVSALVSGIETGVITDQAIPALQAVGAAIDIYVEIRPDDRSLTDLRRSIAGLPAQGSIPTETQVEIFGLLAARCEDVESAVRMAIDAVGQAAVTSAIAAANHATLSATTPFMGCLDKCAEHFSALSTFSGPDEIVGAIRDLLAVVERARGSSAQNWERACAMDLFSQCFTLRSLINRTSQEINQEITNAAREIAKRLVIYLRDNFRIHVRVPKAGERYVARYFDGRPDAGGVDARSSASRIVSVIHPAFVDESSGEVIRKGDVTVS